jgi:hypothetical protein
LARAITWISNHVGILNGDVKRNAYASMTQTRCEYKMTHHEMRGNNYSISITSAISALRLQKFCNTPSALMMNENIFIRNLPMNFKSFAHEMYTYLLFRTSQSNCDSHHKCSEWSARRNSGFVHARVLTGTALRAPYESHNKHWLFPPTAITDQAA